MENLIDGFASLPGIGRKSAQRLAFHVLSLPQEEADRFANAVLEAKKSVHTCPVCQNLTDGELCPVCASDSRDKTTICVVSEPRDVLSIERSREYHGVYHVLHGALSPMNRVGPDDLRIRELLERVAMESIAYCEDNGITDWASIKSRVKSGLSGYLFKKTRRSPMILPIIMEV